MLAKSNGIAKLLDVKSAPALKNPAVAHCAEVYEVVYQAARARDSSEYASENRASEAFRQAMPLLSGYQNICDFIACANYGALIEAIKPEDVSKLMYSAQVALSTILKDARTQTRYPRLPAPETDTLPPFRPNPINPQGLATRKLLSSPKTKHLQTRKFTKTQKTTQPAHNFPTFECAVPHHPAYPESPHATHASCRHS